MKFIRGAAALFLAALAPVATWAQASDWPAAKPIVYVVPFTAGGSTDIVARTLAQKLGDSLKQSVVVDNKPGQAGGIGAAYVAKAKPDGYSCLAAPSARTPSTRACTRTCPTTQ